MTRIVFVTASLAAIAALGACTETHSSSQMEYEAADNNSCLACHTGPSAGEYVHPEAKFPLTTMGTMHDNILCIDCHKFDVSADLFEAGFNSDCTSGCHLQNESSTFCTQYPQAMNMPCPASDSLHQGLGVSGYAWDSKHYDFCLSCHPAGM
jgi:hypothetical protein